jgi:hypothetical protein
MYLKVVSIDMFFFTNGVQIAEGFSCFCPSHRVREPLKITHWFAQLLALATLVGNSVLSSHAPFLLPPQLGIGIDANIAVIDIPS